MATDEEKKQEEQLRKASQTVDNIMGSNSYTPGNAVTKAQEKLTAHESTKPGEYTNRWQSQMDTLLKDILDRKDFRYDVNADPLFQQYRDQYVRNGQMAMRDTMGQAAQLTGGYGNSYAQMAGQQAYNGYLQGLTDKIPELYNLAMQAYNNKTNDMTNRYNVLGNTESKEYSRYQDGVNAYQAELERLQNLYNTERSYDYGMYRDSVSDAQQRWANAWAMFQAGQDTPELRKILGLPEAPVAAEPVYYGGDDGGSSGGGGSSTVRKPTYNDIYKAADTAFKNGDSQLAYNTIASAQKGGIIDSSQGYEISKLVTKYNK